LLLLLMGVLLLHHQAHPVLLQLQVGVVIW
jgi:hypothetical protein